MVRRSGWQTFLLLFFFLFFFFSECKYKGEVYYPSQPIVDEIDGCNECYCGYDGNIQSKCKPSMFKL